MIYAQSEWVNYRVENTQFPSNPYKNIAIDRHGNKWIATQHNGLFRFDGTNWEIFDTSNSPLTTNMINHVFFDTDDNLWVSTNGGGLYQRLASNNNWRIYNTNTQNIDRVNFPTNVVNWVDQEIREEGNTFIDIWVATANGLVRIVPPNAEGQVDFFIYQRSGDNNLPSNDLTSVKIHNVNGTNFRWIGTAQGLVRFHHESNIPQWSVFNTSNSPLTGNGITGIIVDNLGHKWISVYNWQTNTGGGVLRLATNNVNINHSDWTVFNTQLPSNTVRGMDYEIANGNQTFHWFNTEAGIARYNGTAWEIYQNSTTPTLSTNDLYGIAIEGDIKWFGASHNMIRFDGITWSDFYFLNSGIPNNHIQAMTFNPENPIVKWIGTANGMTRFDGSQWRVFNVANSNLPTNDIRALTIDNRGFLWIGTAQFINLGGGLVGLNPANNAMQVFTTVNSDLPSNNITEIAVCSQDRKWVGTDGGGMISLRQDGVENYWETYNKSNSALPSDVIYDIFIDEDDFKWIATDSGVAVMNNNNLVVQIYTKFFTDLPSNVIKRIKKDKEGYIWVVTDEGIAKLVGDNWFTFTTTGLNNQGIRDIDFDVNNIKWISTNQGLFRTNEVDWTVYNTTNSDLMTNSLSFVKIEDIVHQGELISHKWLGSTNLGLTNFRGGQALYPNGSYISVFQHPVISNSLKITAVVNNFRVENVAMTINNVARNYEEIAHNMWLTEYLVEQNQNVRISFRFWHANGDSTLVRNINVSMLQNSQKPVSIGDNALIDVQNSIAAPNWLMTDLIKDENGEVYYQFNALSNVLENNLILRANDGYKIQRRTGHFDWIDVSTAAKPWTLVSYGDYRVLKDNDVFLRPIQNLTNFPNPFNPETTISFDVAVELASVHIDIFNIRGQRVNTLHNGNLAQGNHSFIWNGKNEQGIEVSSGVYFVRIRTENELLNRKIMLLK